MANVQVCAGRFRGQWKDILMDMLDERYIHAVGPSTRPSLDQDSSQGTPSTYRKVECLDKVVFIEEENSKR